MRVIALSSRAVAGVGFGSFVILALPKSAFGVAWPSVATDLTQGLGALGLVIAVHTAGYMGSSAVTGPVIGRVGPGVAFFVSSSVSTAGLLGYAFTGSWEGLLLAAFVLGAGGGLMDAGVNAHLAVRHGARVMNLLHASFGVGATLGPIMMTAFLAAGGSWKSAYLVLAIVQAGLTVFLWIIRSGWAVSPPRDASSTREQHPHGRFRDPVIWLMLAGFMFYAGLEVGAGQWAFSILTESRGMEEGAAGIVVAVYWGSFTAGRLAAGAIGDRVAPERVIRASSIVAGAALATFWWDLHHWIDAAALTILGAALAGVFPAMILLTPRRVGKSATSHVVGYQLAAASVGVGLIPGAAGLLVARYGLESVAPLLLAAAVVVLVVSELTNAMAPATIER